MMIESEDWCQIIFSVDPWGRRKTQQYKLFIILDKNVVFSGEK